MVNKIDNEPQKNADASNAETPVAKQGGVFISQYFRFIKGMTNRIPTKDDLNPFTSTSLLEGVILLGDIVWYYCRCSDSCSISTILPNSLPTASSVITPKYRRDCFGSASCQDRSYHH